MFNEEQRGLANGERRMSLAPILIWLATAYAGLATAVTGFVLENTVLVVAGGILVCSGSVLANLITKARNRFESARLDFYEKGEQCESLHLSPRLLMPSAKNSAFLTGSPSIRTVSMRSPRQPGITNGSTSTSSGPNAKVPTAQPSPTVS
jgi:hypothetical protein